MASKIVAHLTEDEQINGQHFVCLSFVLPEGKIKNCSLSAVKVRGVFSKIEDAKLHAENLRKKDPYFDIYVGEMGKWLPLDPDPNTIEEEQYQEKELNHIISNYKKARDESKTIYDERKKEMMQKIAIEEQEKMKAVNNRLRKKKNNAAGEMIDQLDMDMDLSNDKSATDIIIDKINNRVLELENEQKAAIRSQEFKKIVKEYSEIL
jgi:hypothetical protein